MVILNLKEKFPPSRVVAVGPEGNNPEPHRKNASGNLTLAFNSLRMDWV